MTHDLKPYPKYKDSTVPWLAKVPSHWHVKKLKWEVAFTGGGTPSKARPDFWGGSIPWVSPKDMKRSVIRDAEDHVTKDAVSESATSLVAAGAVLVVVRSGILKRAIPVAINSVEVALNQDLKALRSWGRVKPEYLRALIDGNQAVLLTEWSKQGATVESIEHELMANSSITVPSLAEQSAIVRFLDHADRRIRRYIRAKQKLNSLLEEQRQAIIHRAVTRGLDPKVRLRPSGVEWLGDVPEHWDIRALKHYYREIDERSTSGDEELLSVSHITGVTPRSQKNVTMFKAQSYIDHKICRADDLVVNTMWAWMGALGVSKYLGIVSPSYHVYRPRRSAAIISELFDLLLRSKSYISEYVRRSTGIRSSRLRLYPEEMLRVRVACPPIDEQRSILEHIHAQTRNLDLARTKIAGEISLLREYRTRLIADVVTGKLDVREAAAKLPDEADEPEALDDADTLIEDEDAADGDLEAAPEEVEA